MELAVLASSPTSSVEVTPTSAATLSSAQLTGRGFNLDLAGPFEYVGLWRRHTGPALSTSQQSSTARQATTPLSTQATATISANVSTTLATIVGGTPVPSASSSEGLLFEIGPYYCTATVDLSLLMSILAGHLEDTQDSLNATMKFLILNLHAAASAGDPTGSPRSPAVLPGPNNLLSDTINTNLSSYSYTPAQLQDQRANLNVSGNWFGVTPTNRPDPVYFEVLQGTGHESTPDGWPSESYVELSDAQRVLTAFGRVDPQMEGYNFSGDGSTIFPRGYLQSPRAVSASNTGEITSGCFFNQDVESLFALNNSWAVASNLAATSTSESDSELAMTEASNLTNCGITPVLNETLSNVTADVSVQPYQDYAYSTIWSWAAGQPTNTSGDSAEDANMHCAAMNSTSHGRWQVIDCTTYHYAACRVGYQPYTFQISSTRGSYENVENACPPNSTFAAPRTALENTYLFSLLHASQAQNAIDDDLLYVNFNDLDVQNCWVIGQNATCPYQSANKDPGREIIVPTVAAVIVFVCAALTVFVKCAANRQSSKRRRRRGGDGWDYEGVPS